MPSSTCLAHIPNSIKVALGIGQLHIWKLLFGGHSSKALHCILYAQMPNCQRRIAKGTFIELGIYVEKI